MHAHTNDMYIKLTEYHYNLPSFRYVDRDRLSCNTMFPNSQQTHSIYTFLYTCYHHPMKWHMIYCDVCMVYLVDQSVGIENKCKLFLAECTLKPAVLALTIFSQPSLLFQKSKVYLFFLYIYSHILVLNIPSIWFSLNKWNIENNNKRMRYYNENENENKKKIK
jgi:hypothetical protein